MLDRATLLLGAAAIALLASHDVGRAQSSPAMKPVVKIGVLTDMTSVFSDLVGRGSVIATQLAVEDFEKLEKPNFKVEVISADHSSKADIASNTARAWFDQEGVDVITDVAGAAVTLAVSKVGTQKNRIVLATASGQNSLSSEDCQPTTLHWSYNTRTVAGPTADAITRAGGKKWFFLTADYAGGRSLEEDATRAVVKAGGQVIGSAKHPFPNHEFSSQLLSAQAAGATVVALANSGPDATTAIKQAREYGIDKTAVLAGLLTFVTDVDAMGLEVAKGMYITEPFYWDTNDATRAWSKRFFEKHKKMPTMVQAGAYSGALHYLRAVKKAGTTEADAVLKAMREMPVDDMFAPGAKLREDQILIHDMQLYQVKSPEESKYPWDYYKHVRTVPAAEAFAPLSESKCSLVKKSN
ncbi:ABC transporter substrate-binding protein [Enterovirga sp. CN4-39]|uniref:ABC transporter substrate-binding protein n=1 Tax=Enterovirga sp. CN4-39 TaxID=3400910 RepID=UPI003BFB46F1